MSAKRTERLLNLTIALLATRRPLSKGQIRRGVPQYADAESLEAFDRMFERDKEELRELGIPVTSAQISTVFEDEPGYRIDPEAYALPDIEFTAAENAMLALAARVWQQARLSGVAGRAMTKLQALGVDPDDQATLGLEPRIATTEPSFPALYEASRDGHPVTFTYRAAGGDSVQRTVEPWRLTSWHGHWYLVGFDRVRQARRIFRLSRITGAVRIGFDDEITHPAPADLDAGAAIAATFSGEERDAVVVDLRDGRGNMLRRDATPRDGAPKGWQRVEVTGRADQLAGEVAALGEDAVAVSPSAFTSEVAALIRSAVHAHQLPVPALPKPPKETPKHRSTRRPAPGAAEHLSRLLSMASYLQAHQGIPTPDAAKHFGLTETQLIKDLELLFVCGLPGHMPDDLIEAEWDSGRVYLRNADTIARPLTLSLDEAVSLLIGLRMLAEIPGIDDRAGVEGAMAKLTEAVGGAAAQADAVQVALDADDSRWLTPFRDAVQRHRLIRLVYLVPSRDEQTTREVSPMRVLSMAGRWYLEAWCHRSDGVRTFRLDRVLEAEVTDTDGTPPPQAQGRDLTDEVFQPSPDDDAVDLLLKPHGAWVREYYNATSLGQTSTGDELVRLRTRDTDWVVGLALRSGGSVRVVAPTGLAKQVLDEAARTEHPTGYK